MVNDTSKVPIKPHPPLRGPRDSPLDCHAPEGRASHPPLTSDMPQTRTPLKGRTWVRALPPFSLRKINVTLMPPRLASLFEGGAPAGGGGSFVAFSYYSQLRFLNLY